ncbi:protein-(glutamine-N5) methyltransferase [Bifidobacterium pseudolongum]|uniref:Protein-(Glutamine-N5) methyltransferase n=1 Tax=Bifidobacterium pseudolongum TaxID=1694 RepID=A0A395XF66_9BIFI|nr:protein-(glutamine-N5) methyltransferase [Bifidobacterium pseudolongum]RGW09959.1 protein-(glutamine-N5) methyltransferase [Bifidobacterium pseudolongum]
MMAEIVTMKIGPRKILDYKETDYEGTIIPAIGWEPDMSEEEIWACSAGWWKLEPGRAVRCDIGIVLNPDNIVVCVAKIKGIVKRDDMRMRFLGELAGEYYHPWIGKTLERNDSKNPIAYFDERAIIAPEDVSANTKVLNRK